MGHVPAPPRRLERMAQEIGLTGGLLRVGRGTEGHQCPLETLRKLLGKSIKRPVGRLEADRELEWLLRVSLIQKPADFRGDHLGFQMNGVFEQGMGPRVEHPLLFPDLRRTVARHVPEVAGSIVGHIMAGALVPVERLVRVSRPEIKCPRGLVQVFPAARINAPLADESGMVTRITQERRIRLPEVRQAGLEVVHSMASRVLSGERACAADRANRRGDEGMGEEHSPLRECVEIRSFDLRVAFESHGPHPQIVGQEKNDVRALGIGRFGSCLRRHGGHR